MSVLAFDSKIAATYGVNEAILLNNIQYWVRHNKYNKSQENFYDGKYWTWNTQEALTNLFPFWSLRTIQRIIASLVEQNLIITCQPNKNKHDRTTWYTLTDETWGSFDSDKLSCSKRQNGVLEDAKLSCSEDAKLSCSYNNIDNNIDNIISTPLSPEGETVVNKKETDSKTCEPNFTTHQFTEPEQLAIKTWLQHKKEKRQPYKPTGLKTLLSILENEKSKGCDIIQAIHISISNASWSGIVYDKGYLHGRTPASNSKPQFNDIGDFTKNIPAGNVGRI